VSTQDNVKLCMIVAAERQEDVKELARMPFAARSGDGAKTRACSGLEVSSIKLGSSAGISHAKADAMYRINAARAAKLTTK
jgi:hypothetical protein